VRETLATLHTLVGLLQQVHCFYVLVQVSEQTERLAAVLAFERLFFQVNCISMSLQINWSPECFPTSVA